MILLPGLAVWLYICEYSTALMTAGSIMPCSNCIILSSTYVFLLNTTVQILISQLFYI